MRIVLRQIEHLPMYLMTIHTAMVIANNMQETSPVLKHENSSSSPEAPALNSELPSLGYVKFTQVELPQPWPQAPLAIYRWIGWLVFYRAAIPLSEGIEG